MSPSFFASEDSSFFSPFFSPFSSSSSFFSSLFLSPSSLPCSSCLSSFFPSSCFLSSSFSAAFSSDFSSSFVFAFSSPASSFSVFSLSASSDLSPSLRGNRNYIEKNGNYIDKHVSHRWNIDPEHPRTNARVAHVLPPHLPCPRDGHVTKINRGNSVDTPITKSLCQVWSKSQFSRTVKAFASRHVVRIQNLKQLRFKATEGTNIVLYPKVMRHFHKES